MAHCCSTMWGGLLKLIMLIASIMPYRGLCISLCMCVLLLQLVIMSSHDLTAANGDKEYITPSPVITPPLLTFSDTEEELNESFSDDPTDHNMNKSWLK